MKEQRKADSRKKKSKWPLILLLLLLFAILGGICTLIFPPGESASPSHYLLDINMEPIDKQKGSIPDADIPENQRIIIPGVSQIGATANSRSAMASFENNKANPCYFKVIVKMGKGGDVIYESDLISPDKAIYTFQLNRTFSKGEYPVSIQFCTFSLDEMQAMNGAIVKSKLIVN